MKMSDCFQILFFDEILALFGLNWRFRHISPVTSHLSLWEKQFIPPLPQKARSVPKQTGPFPLKSRTFSFQTQEAKTVRTSKSKKQKIKNRKKKPKERYAFLRQNILISGCPTARPNQQKKRNTLL